MAIVLVTLVTAACATTSSTPRGATASYTLVNARGATTVFVGDEVAGCGCALVHVDGFDNSLEDARANFDAVVNGYRESGGTCRAYGFAWRSDPGLLSLRRAEREVDERAGASLASVLDQIADRCPASSISVTSHSLGARVVLRALAHRAARGRAPVDSIALAAPAVPAVELRSGGALASGLSGSRRIAIFRNSEDYILGVLYPLFTGGRAALGQFGLRSALRDVVARAAARGTAIFDIDCASIWGPHHSARESFDARFWSLYFAHLGVPDDAARLRISSGDS